MKTVKQLADEIREGLRGGTLFGQPLDMQDTDAMIIAAYNLGVRDGLHQAQEQEARKPQPVTARPRPPRPNRAHTLSDEDDD